MRRALALLVFLVAVMLSGAASSQTLAIVVASCGANTLYNPFGTEPVTMDVTGKLCTSSAGGGGGAVTIANGADVALGSTTDSVCGTPTGTCTLEALTKFVANAVNSAIPAGTNLIGKVGIDQTTPGTTNAVQPISGATGGATPYHFVTTASTNSQNIKAAAAGTLYTISAVNFSATASYLRIYDQAAAPTCSSATGAVHSYGIPASTSGAGISISIAVGELYANGIGYCVTGASADTDNSNGQAGITINASFK